MQNISKQQKSQNTSKTYSNTKDLVKKNILGVEVTSASQKEILEYIVETIEKSTKPYYIVTPNPEMIVLAHKNSRFNQVLNSAKIALNDGVGVSIAAQVMGIPLKERFTGVDLVENVCKAVADWPITVGFLGGRPQVAEMTSKCLMEKYPNLKVAFVGEEWPEQQGERGKGKGESQKNQEDKKLHPSPLTLHPSVDILFVALGFPKQEFWMAKNVGKIPVKVLVGVGGAFDYISGKVPRAPKIVRSIGMEWLFRLIVQPWRIKRQLALVEFMWMVLRENFFPLANKIKS